MSQFLKQLSSFSLPEPAELFQRAIRWLKSVAPWWGASLVGHLAVLLLLALILGTVNVAQTVFDAPTFDVDNEPEQPLLDTEITHFDLGEAPLEPTVLDTESLLMAEAPTIEQTELKYDDSPVFEEAGGGVAASSALSLGGLGGFDIDAVGPGPAVRGDGGVGTGVGTSNRGGSGGSGSGFGGRGSGMRKALVGSFGGTKQTERAVAAGLNWLARHQNPDGSWSLDKYPALCQDPTCTTPGRENSDAAATAFALLPFLAAGQTHESKGPYQNTIRNGLLWLVNHQKSDGDLSAGAGQMMYTHGLAAIAVCEAYGLTQDKRIGTAAQAAVLFIEAAQHPVTGGWRYSFPPAQEGDTSVVGWQVMALKSAQMAGLEVNPASLEGSRKFLKSCSSGSAGGMFGYEPGGGGGAATTAIGLLCYQYMGTGRNDAAMVEGARYLMQTLPNNEARNLYYWYYATQVMHNIPGPQWDQWNRHTRRILIESQVKEGCAMGSWDPMLPAKDAWGEPGGRIMITSLAVLSLEVYYRYLPLYQLDKADQPKVMAAADKQAAAP